MADDITDRLRWCRWRDRSSGEYTSTYDIAGIEAERIEAANAIERLRRELATLRANERACDKRTSVMVRPQPNQIAISGWRAPTAAIDTRREYVATSALMDIYERCSSVS